MRLVLIIDAAAAADTQVHRHTRRAMTITVSQS